MTQGTGGRRPRERSRGAGLAVLLIIVGVLILLGNFGWLSWGVLARVANLWPVLLVAIGADMLTRRRYSVVVWGAAVVVGALLYAYDTGGIGGQTVWGTAAGELRTISHPLSGANAADVTITTSVGTLRLAGLSGGDQLVEGSIRTGRGETLVDELSHRGDVAVLRLTSDQRPGVNIGAGERREWDLRLTRGVPIALSVKTGVGSAHLDLQRVTLSSLRMEAGVGEVDATLPESGIYRAEFKSGVGATHITIPKGMAARVTVDGGLGAVHVNGTFARSGDTYETPGYPTASDRVDLTVDGGLGRITIDR